MLKNRWASDFFRIQRGVRQGFPLSSYLFILAAEVLAKAFSENKNVTGIFVNEKEINISQYADDTMLTLDGTKISLLASLQFLDDYYEVSGLRFNNKKTEAFWIEANCRLGEIPLPGREFKWPIVIKFKIKAFGVWFSIDPEATTALNYQEKLNNVCSLS